MLTLEVHLRDTETGATKVHLDVWCDEVIAKISRWDPGFDPVSTMEFLWSEGNYACDCNRSLFLYGDERRQSGCSDGRIVVDLAFVRETGQVLCKDDSWSLDWGEG